MMRSRRKRPPLALLAGGAVLAGLVGALFWFAAQADRLEPELRDIRMEAENVGPR